MDRIFFPMGAVSGFIAVAAGASGAHALRHRIAPEYLTAFETAARYQMYHALALLAAGWVVSRRPGALPRWAAWCFVLGTVLFSGSLYALALTGVRWLGAVTPLGGIAFMLGWICLGMSGLRR